MKKLTAGIFTVLMGLVTVNAAEAAVASKGYVDEKVGGATTSIEALTETVAANKSAAEKLVNDYKAENDAKVNANTAAIEKNAEDILANTGLISDNADAIAANTQAIEGEKTARETADTGLDTRLKEVEKFSGNGEGSVAKQIADAVAGEKSAREAADTALETSLKTYADQAEADAIATAGTAADGKIAAALESYSTTTEMDTAIKNANDAQTTTITEAYEAADATLQGKIDAMDTAYKAADTTLQGNIDAINNPNTGILKQAQTYADGLDAAQKTAFENADKAISDKIGTVPADKTVVGMIADAQTAATYNDTEVRGLISDNADAIDAIKASDYATSGITAAKVSIYDGYNAKITENTEAAAAAQTQADKGVADAATAQAAADAAQATADAAIPAPTPECSDKGSKCVLTSGENGYAWEVIQRGDDEVVE